MLAVAADSLAVLEASREDLAGAAAAAVSRAALASALEAAEVASIRPTRMIFSGESLRLRTRFNRTLR